LGFTNTVLNVTLFQELGLSDDHCSARDPCDCCILDVSDDWEQVEALKAAAECSSEIGLSKVSML